MNNFLTELNDFAAANRWVFWPVVGAVVTTVMGLRSIGWEKFRSGNHPIQALVAMVVLGALGGLLMAWLTKVIFH